MRLIAFRFAVVYFGLYAFATQIAGGVLLIPAIQVPALGTTWPMRDITLWIAEHVFGATPPLLYAEQRHQDQVKRDLLRRRIRRCSAPRTPTGPPRQVQFGITLVF